MPATSTESFTYEWDRRAPFTNDPRYQPLERGDESAPRVFLDGVDTGRDVTRCKSGPRGWVERHVRDPKGELVVSPEGEAMREKLGGDVQILPPRK